MELMTGDKKKLEWYHILIIIYAVVMNIAAAVVTVKDKECAKKKRWRISEKNLLILAALSGCITMYITMKMIHHKTKHNLFMVGIPIIFICEVLAGLGIYAFMTMPSA